MRYEIEVFDRWERRIAVFDDAPLLDVIRSTPDDADCIRGLLPSGIPELGHAYRIAVRLEGERICEGLVELLRPCWSDARKLILDRYVTFHELLEVEARSPMRAGNTRVSRACVQRELAAAVKDIINAAPGPIHYTVAHTAYPDGACREFAKFLARTNSENELESGGISEGQWVGADRLDVSNAYAKDGDTIAGIVVDGAPWPDCRLMLIDAEERTRNAHAIKRHPEIAGWSGAQYDASPYKRRAEAATALLQRLIDTKGIDFIELNPHRDASGAFDDRVDAYGRYLGLVYGGGECFNAALVEEGLADVYLWEEGRYHVPEMALKDFFSYAGQHEDSVENTGITLNDFDVKGGAIEVLTALCYMAGGYVFSVDLDLAVRFRRAAAVDRVLYFDPVTTGIHLGSDSRGMVNYLSVEGHPLSALAPFSQSQAQSIGAYGLRGGRLEYFSLTQRADAEKLAAGLLEDLAWPEPAGQVLFHQGDPGVRVGDLLALRGLPLRRCDQEAPEEWGGRFTGKHVGRVRQVRHRLSGKHVSTTVLLGSPLRSVGNPLQFIVCGQDSARSLFEFRLDDAVVGLDMGYHLD